MKLNDRAVLLFEKYDVDVISTRKGRGAIIAQTGQGELELVLYNGQDRHLFLEYALLSALREKQEKPLDTIFCTKDGKLSCTDYEGKKYIVKKYVDGKECSVYEEADIIRAARGLAELHGSMRGIDLAEPAFLERLRASLEPQIVPEDEESGPEDEESRKQQEEFWDGLRSYETFDQTDRLSKEFDKRTSELIRVRNYIRKKSRKDDFELTFIKLYDEYMEQAAKAVQILDPLCEEMLQKWQLENRMYAHGDSSQHNLLNTPDGVTLINFEKAGAHLQAKDLYLYMRKVLEKNNWSFRIGELLLHAYETVLPLTEAERNYLYARFVYPEKFWKVANGYLNRPRCVPVKRQLEKLLALQEKEAARQAFLHKWVETYH